MNDVIMTDHSSTSFFALLLFFPLGCFAFLILICMGSLYIVDIYCVIACVEIFTSSVAFKFCEAFNLTTIKLNLINCGRSHIPKIATALLPVQRVLLNFATPSSRNVTYVSCS